MSKNYIIALVH